MASSLSLPLGLLRLLRSKLDFRIISVTVCIHTIFAFCPIRFILRNILLITYARPEFLVITMHIARNLVTDLGHVLHVILCN
jgi:hypothetical protein